MEHTNLPDVFRELSLEGLSDYAEEWFKEFPAISKISLYRYKTPVGLWQGDRIPVKFCVVFSVKADSSEEEREKLWRATERRRTIKDQSSFTKFMTDRSFPETVYKEGKDPKGFYFKLEWRFFAPEPDNPNEPVPEGVCTNRRHWVLYDQSSAQAAGEGQGEPEERAKEETESRLPQQNIDANLLYPAEVLSLMHSACPEIEKLWKGLQSIKRKLIKEGSLYDLYQKAALTFHDNNSGIFEIVKKEHLEDSAVFFPKSDNPEERHLKRTIVGKLYQEVISRAFPKELPEPDGKQDYSIKKLYTFHKAELKKISPTSPQLLPNPV